MKSAALALALACCLSAGCGDSPEPDPRSEGPVATPAKAEPGRTETARASARPRGRPLPAFSGITLDDRRLDISDYVGRRLVLFFFNPEVRTSRPATQAINRVARARGEHNFAIVGIATGSDRKTAQAFVAEQGIEFPVIDDSTAQLARRFGLRDPLALVGVDSEGFIHFGMAGFGEADVQAVEANLKRSLRLSSEDAVDGSGRIVAPTFRASVMDDPTPFDLAAHRGESIVLIFFLHTCPHCHSALRFLRGALEAIPEEQRPLLVGLEISGRTYAVRQMLKEEGLDFFPVLFDDDGSIAEDYGVFAGVPDIFLIDAEGRIARRFQGWHGETQETLVRMWLEKLAGRPVPMLLRTNGYSGSDVCGVCHELEHETWTFTNHASAFDTLVKHGADREDECIGCHVVGYEAGGGFVDAQQTPNLEDVGCESCHGRGGPHLSPGFVAGDYAAVCSTCHDAKHSLGFDYEIFRPRISHVENAALVGLPPEEKRRRLAGRGRPGKALLPTRAAHVGSEACRSCHEAEYETWAASPHARAGQTLEKQGRAGDADCQRCHTTAFERPGGFAAGSAFSDHPDLARVGCESCHGPGGDHVAEGAPRIGTIVSLGDKCDSCVILQICGSCHDDANDPGFEFEVQEKIERQRHGTLEPGTGRPLGPTAGAPPDDAELLARAFALADRERLWTQR